MRDGMSYDLLQDQGQDHGLIFNINVNKK